MRLLRQRTRFGKAIALTLAASTALSTSIQPALAFCGFYVARADGKLFNKASKVVLAWKNGQTAVTMASDYQGDPKDFALVIPVPTIVKQSDIHVVDQAIIDHLDDYSAPRLVEYTDDDPCDFHLEEAMVTARLAMPAPAGSASAPMVTVEARYSVEEYEIVILSAGQSDALQSWLTENGYKIPDGAADVLGSYIKQGMHFFVAKVDLNRMALSGRHFIRPIQVRYGSPKFMLPIRLGTVNANGPQDLILMTLTTHGRVEATNYQTTRIPSDIDVPLYIKDRFVDFYRTVFDREVERTGGTNVFLEYAWNTSWCDPCAAQPPSRQDLTTLGADWQPDSANVSQFNPGGPFITRLHVRYDRAHFPEDIALNETYDDTNFQGRYIMHHAWVGKATCPAVKNYRKMVAERAHKEMDSVAGLTGWSQDAVRADMNKSGEVVDYNRSVFDFLFN